METATLAGGCFWCTEAVFASLRGVKKVTPGYTGGHVENPTYEQVSSGKTGHAEAVQIEFDPKEISFKELLFVFFKLHDPTQLNRQEVDIGTQYRSAIFHHDKVQQGLALQTRNTAQRDYKDPIVTEIAPFKNFYPAEEKHREYYFKNRNTPYCMLVIDPKIQKLKKDFKNYLK